MEKNKETALEKLLGSYEAYYDIDRNVKTETALYDAKAEFHSRSEKYVLVKSAKLWAAETNEYAYFKIVDKPSANDIAFYGYTAYRDGFKLVKPHNEHMYSYVTLVLLCDEIDETAVAAIKSQRYKKSFRFAFHGWTEFHFAVIECRSGKIYTNAAGKTLKKSLGEILK